jgi:uncharacterized RDD family membrane protein YckC
LAEAEDNTLDDQTVTNPYAPPQATVRDIADPTARTEPAERVTRLGAAVLDGIIGMVIIIFGNRNGENLATVVAGSLVILAGVAAWGWLTYVNVKRSGQTLGKKMVSIKVVRTDGSPASVGRIFWLRNVVNALIGAIPLLGSIYSLVDILFIFSDTRQCLHDKLADTIVVKA